MNRPVLFVDIDGVMADSVPWWLTLFNKDNGTNHKISDVTIWDTRICINADLSPYFSNYDGVLPIDLAFFYTDVLSSKYRIVYATVGLGSEWLTRHSLPKPEIAVIQDKSLLRGFALIDDNPTNLDGFVGERFL